jgi:glycosyltransferase involved in cell wall biosynthesis
MSTHNPDMDLFRAQVRSLIEQTDPDWVCFVSDDCSRPERYAEIEEVLAGDSRFVLSRSERRLGFYRGFERALGMAPPELSLVALCDQDDRWYPEKLATLRAELGRAMLVYSDQRLVDETGSVISETYWNERTNNHTNLISLLVANTITGAASLMRREVVERALPFPDVPGDQYHDHWLGLVALTMGEVAYVDRPLYDYVQHGAAALGHAAANAGLTGPHRMSLREHLRLGSLRRLVGDGRGAYFFGYERLAVLARVLIARCAGGARRSKLRALRRFERAERRPLRGTAWLALRRLRRLWGRDETLGVERLLIQGILWRYALPLRAFGVERPRGWTYDASMPPLGAAASVAPHRDQRVAHIQQIISPLELSVSTGEPRRINVLLPTIDLKHLFGGYIAKFNLARRLAERGHRVRIVAVDPTPPLPSDWRQRVEAYRGLAGTFERVEVAFAREADRPLPVNPADTFVATTWWTAHVANAALAETEGSRFLYLIQEYEPFTFEMGSLAALAMQSYGFPHAALFSTELLREFFARHRYGAFAAGEAEGKQASASFDNAITPVQAPAAAALASRDTRRLLFYARAEQHARRNMFELGLIALSTALERGVFGPEWEFGGVGSVEGRSSIGLPGGRVLEIHNRLPQAQYSEMLARHDVGLSLMFTPHPSLVPLEMASAGLLTVTNSFENKGPEELRRISPNLIVAEPTIEGVVEGLAEAAAGVGDYERRVRGSAVDWSSDWDATFDDAVMDEIELLLERCRA